MADFEGIERISAATGAEILANFDDPENADRLLGYCGKIEEIIIGEDSLILFSDCKKNEACTIVIRGPSNQIMEEIERSLHDVLCVLVSTI